MPEQKPQPGRPLRERVRRHFITGLLVIVPLWLTWFVIASLVKRIDRVLAILPEHIRPETWLPFPIPGLGVILTLVTIQLVGILGANLLGRGFVRSFEGLLRRIPFVRGIYGSAQQVLRQIVAEEANRFKRVVLVRYPGGEGLYRLGFVTGERPGIGADGRPTTRAIATAAVFLRAEPRAAGTRFRVQGRCPWSGSRGRRPPWGPGRSPVARPLRRRRADF